MAGFYGKLPAKGDFLSRHLPREFIDHWDTWLQSGMHASREALGEAWLQIYLTSPLWRFVLASGTCGESAWAGVMMPSMDKVGRYFPMTVAARLPPPVMPALAAHKCKSWFSAVENHLLEALDDESLDVDAFDETLQNCLLDDEPDSAADITSDLDHGVRAPLNDELDLAHAVLGLAAGMPDHPLRSCSIWWGQGSERIAPGLVFSRGLPGPGKFTALLDGNWTGHGWRESKAEAVDPAAIAADLAAV